jgi:hypothetical protein
MDTPFQMPNDAEQKQEEKHEEPKKETPGSGPTVVKEIHHHHHYRKGPGMGGIFFGIIVIFVGLLFLARSLGWFPEGFHFNWNIVWPLIIIFVGLSMLSRHGLVSWIIGGLVTLGVGAIMAHMMCDNNMGKNETTTEAVTVEQNAAATSSTLNVHTGAGKLAIVGGSEKLVSGTFTSSGFTLNKEDSLSNANQTVTLQTKGSWAWFGNHRNDLDLKLANDIPTAIKISSGASDMDIDLSSVMATSVDVDTGASDLVLTLGDKVDQSSVKIDAGASSIVVNLPKTLGAKLLLDAGATSKTLTDFTEIDSKTFESKNYGTATQKVTLEMDLGAASLTINWK